MIFDVLTLFPGIFVSPLRESIVKRAIERGVIDVRIVNIRDFAKDRHRTVDDKPYGGGEGMVMKVEPVVGAIRSIENEDVRVVLLTPQGRLFNQSVAREMGQYGHIALVCGRYEGVDDRIRAFYVDDEVSVGDFVLTGGEMAALVIIDAVTRLLPDALGSDLSTKQESFEDGLLEYPQYTRPCEFEGRRIPDILLSGNHGKIKEWRRREQLKRTLLKRPDLLKSAPLSGDDLNVLGEIREDLDRREYS